MWKAAGEIIPHRGERERSFFMIVLGVLLVLLAAYLVYALVNPEKF